MAFKDRKPDHLASLIVPTPRAGSEMNEIHTPIPYTPIPFEPAPLVMTPDTPSFDLPTDRTDSAGGSSDWSDAEDAMITQYLNYPPRPLQTTYPPGSLPPPAALDELTSQLINSSDWTPRRDWQSTRSRFLELARRSSASLLGGKKRTSSTRVSSRTLFASPLGSGSMEVTPTNTNVTPLPEIAEPRPVRPKLRVLGGAKMSRQQHSMDSLYGDQQPGTMSEALRLSTTLQNTAGRGIDLQHLNDGNNNQSLSSPLNFRFTFNAQGTAGKSILSSSLPSNRPTSLLHRGRSFTAEVPPSIPSTIDESDHCESSPSPPLNTTSPIRVLPEMCRSASSPLSAITTSPPSSISSATSATSKSSFNTSIPEEAIDFDEPEPFTPLNQIFPNSLGLREPPSVSKSSNSDRSGQTTPAGREGQASTPAITLTLDSPTLDETSSTPKLIAPSFPSSVAMSSGSESGSNSSDTIPSTQLSRMTLNQSTSTSTTTTSQISPKSGNSSGSKAPGIPIQGSRLQPNQGSSSSGRATRPAPLSRSFSEGMQPPSTLMRPPQQSRMSVLSRPPQLATGGGLLGPGLGPMVKRQKGGLNGQGLSVFVPRPSGRPWAEELRSPFEHKASLAPSPNGGHTPIAIDGE